jgi:hypothetical protein
MATANGSRKNAAAMATIDERSLGSILAFVLRKKAAHCVCFMASSANSAVSATGRSLGSEVPRRSNVARIARDRGHAVRRDDGHGG